MALAAILAALDGLPADVSKEYRPASDAEVALTPSLKGKFVLDVSPVEGFGLDNVDQLKSTLGQEKARADKAETAFSGFEGLKAEEVKAKLTKLADLEKLDPTKEADKIAIQKFEAMKGELISAHEAEKKPLQERAEVLFKELDTAKRVQSATTAIIEAGGNPDVLLPHVLGQTKFVEKDGKFDVQVVDAQGTPRVGDAQGGPMTLTSLVEEFKAKEAFAPLFEASGKSGGGAQQGGGGGKPPTNLKKSEMDLNARAEYIEKHGQEAYMSLAA